MTGDIATGPPLTRKCRPGQGSGIPVQNQRRAEYGIGRAVDPLLCERLGHREKGRTYVGPQGHDESFILVKPARRTPMRATERMGRA